MALWSCSGAGQAHGCMRNKSLLWHGFLRGFDFKGKIAVQEPGFDIHILERICTLVERRYLKYNLSASNVVSDKWERDEIIDYIARSNPSGQKD